MKKLLLTALLLAPAGLSAQDIYKVESLSGSDLSGTARYVGMAGAMSALGADLSVMNTNPAGIGLYRKSDIAITGGVTSQPDAESFYDISRARASFDQAGFVWSSRLGGDGVKFLNVGFNYRKRRNFKNYIDCSAPLSGGMSQTWQMADLAYGYDLSTEAGEMCTTPLTVGGYQSYLIDDDGNGGYFVTNADSYRYTRVRWGGIQEYSFNISMNVQERYYFGLTVGAYHVKQKSGLLYTEYADGYDPYELTQEESLSGTGVDLNFGFIFRPVEDSPFRLGLSVKTPTFYDLTQHNYFYIASPWQDEQGKYCDYEYWTGDYDYKVRTPWVVNISAATTVGQYLAIDAEYEVAKYAGSRIKWPTSYDWYDTSWDAGETDKGLREEIKHFMKPVSTFRLGLEGRVTSNVYLRAGYNYVSSPFKRGSYLNLFCSGPSYNYSTQTDYVNLGATQRVAFGAGYKGKHWYVDFAYQYQSQDAKVYAFHVPENGSEQNRLSASSQTLKRQNAMVTLGYRF